MDTPSPLSPGEARPLNNRSSLTSAETMDSRDHQDDRSVSPLSQQASNTYHNEAPGGRGGTHSYTPVGSQEQKQHGLHHQVRETPSQSGRSGRWPWLMETLSIAIAALALAAVIITLVLRKDRPIPKWPSAITINALIAVFTAIFKACLMMPIAEGIGQLKWLWYQKPRPLSQMEEWDSASRGPWGSLLLIFALKGRDIAVLGALLTVVAMAIDPFTQQIVQFYSCSRVIEGEFSSVPFSNNYTAGFLGRPTGIPELDSQMLSAMYTGLLNPPVNVSAALDFDCRTGNCTFPSTPDGAAFLSLGLRSRCADITRNVSVSTYERNYTDSFDESHISITTNASLPDYGIYLTNESFYWPMQSGSKYPSDWPSSSLLSVAFLMASFSSTLERTDAFECDFQPVVNTYSANITNGVLLEQVLDSQPMDVWSVPYATHTLLMVNKTIRAGEWHQCNKSKEPSDEHNFPVVNRPDSPGPVLGTFYPLEVLTNETLSYGGVWNYTEWWPEDCVFWIDGAPSRGLAASLDSFLGNESLFMDPWTDRAQGQLWSVNLWRNGASTLETVQDAMDGLARSITARWRQGDGISYNASVSPVVGTVWGNETCVRVNWAWITLPAAMLLLTALFLVLTITMTDSAQVWKSSIFAVLFNGFDQDMRQAVGPAVTLEGMKAAADRATVRLDDTEEGVRLVGTYKQDLTHIS